MVVLAFIFLALSFLSMWIKRTPIIWGTFLFLSLFSGLTTGLIAWKGFPDALALPFILCLLFLWIAYDRQPKVWLFAALVCLSMMFKLNLLPGYQSYIITSKYSLRLQTPLIGLFPLAFVVPLARHIQDWKDVIKGCVLGMIGIAALAILAIMSGTIRWGYSISPYLPIFLLTNFIFTCIPEEAFFRGFVQKTLCEYFKGIKGGNGFALILSSLLFSFAHIAWSPNLSILVFTFIAGLLYGGVYLYSNKIESAILTHFLLNFMHVVFFNYHALD